MNAMTKTTAPAMVLRPQSFGELMQFADMASRSQMVPKDFQGKPENIMLAVQMGSELGLAPMQALQNIAIVNGRPSVWGDALPGLCRQSGVCKDIREWFDGEGDNLTAYCEATRVGATPVLQSFSVADAKRAGLWKESPKVRKTARDGSSYETDSGPWYAYPKRMLQMRARGFALRDAFPDVLRGLISAEEAQDIPPDTFTGTTINATPEPVADPPAKRTIADALADFEEKIIADDTQEAYEAVMASEATLKLDAAVKGAAAERFRAIVETGAARFKQDGDANV